MIRLSVTPDGTLYCGQRRFACALGRSGVTAAKREGDGATPAGIYTLRRVMYRPDRLDPPSTGLPVSPLGPDMGWCDDPAHADYNRPVRLPHPASCETLWRDDPVYDLVVVLGHNDDRPVPGAGSAIFMHLRRDDGGPTEGCVALALADLLTVLAECGPGDEIYIEA